MTNFQQEVPEEKFCQGKTFLEQRQSAASITRLSEHWNNHFEEAVSVTDEETQEDIDYPVHNWRNQY